MGAPVQDEEQRAAMPALRVDVLVVVREAAASVPADLGALGL